MKVTSASTRAFLLRCHHRRRRRHLCPPLHNLPHLTVSALLLSALLGGWGGVVVAILAAQKVKEIYGAMLGLHHVW
jgi:hypothetical protein